MKKTIRLTESDLSKLIKKVIKEQSSETNLEMCYGDGLYKGLNMLKNSPTIKIITSPKNQDDVLVTDANGKVCVCKKQEIFKI